jgi:pSer/pThr/pTyr-binding forkhead associated (FHA) protein
VKLTLFFPDAFPDLDLAGKTWSFDPEEAVSREWRIGRAHDNDLRVSDRRVSRYHCAIAYSVVQKRWSISDLASTYGTQLDGRGLKPGNWEPIDIGSRFSLGFPDLTIVVIEEEQDTWGEHTALETQPPDLPPESPVTPKTYADSVYLFVSWAFGAKSAPGKVYRICVAAVLVSLVIMLFLAFQ